MDALAPTRARYKVIVFGVVLAAIQYVDRICISKAAPKISADLKFDSDQMAWVFAAFTIAYALFEIPTGWMGDKFGTRKTLVRVVLWWSAFTAATGWMFNFLSMFVCRFLFGMGEAGCFPNLTRAFSSWLRPEEKVRAQAILWMCARLGGAATPLIVTIVLRRMTWNHAFVLFGSLGVVWAFFFWRWFRDEPKDHPEVNQAERALLANNPPPARHDAVPWLRFMSVPTTWLLWLQYFFFSYCWYFYVTWLSTFLDKNYPGVGEYQRAALAGVPLFCGAFGNLVAGVLMPRLNRWGGVLKARRLIGFVAFTCAAACFLVPSRVMESPGLVMLAMGAASFFGDLSMPCSWGTCMDVGGKFAGTYSGSMNMMGNLGGAVSPVAVAWLVKHWNYQVAFDVSAAVYFLAGLCWLAIDPVTPLDKEIAAAHDPVPAPDSKPATA